VIEHVLNPDKLMNYLASIKGDRLHISTPELEILYGFDQSGPPINPARLREWTKYEFGEYVKA